MDMRIMALCYMALVAGFGLGYIAKDLITIEENAIERQKESKIRELLALQQMEKEWRHGNATSSDIDNMPPRHTKS